MIKLKYMDKDISPDINRDTDDRYLGTSKGFSWDTFNMEKFFEDADKVKEIMKRKEEKKDE